MKTNVKINKVSPMKTEMSTYEKAERSLMTCLLWEDNFYEDGESIVERLKSYVPKLSEDECRTLLTMAKKDNKLKHAPLLWALCMLKRGFLKPEDVFMVADRVDFMAEMLNMYWTDENNKHSVPKALKKGLAQSLKRFDAYQLAKWKGKGNQVSLKDVISIVRPVPENDEQSKLWKQALDNTLPTPDTWEVALSAGKDKKETWTRLLKENKLGAMALLKNLRNFEEAKVSNDVVNDAIANMKTGRILPTQFITAKRYCKDEYIKALEKKMLETVQSFDKLPGKTLVMVDASGSMSASLSNRGETTRIDAAFGLAMLLKEICEDSVTYLFDTSCEKIGSHHSGFSYIDVCNEVFRNQLGGGTNVEACTNRCMKKFAESHDGQAPDRIIVLTDEATGSGSWYSDEKLKSLTNKQHGYIINLAPYEKGVEMNNGWTRINGWSENIIKYIQASEKKD